MNRRSLIALGLATALARFFPLGLAAAPKSAPSWRAILESAGFREVDDPVRCPFVFQGSMCGYNGQSASCDKSFERCRELGNAVRFGGSLVRRRT